MFGPPRRTLDACENTCGNVVIFSRPGAASGIVDGTLLDGGSIRVTERRRLLSAITSYEEILRQSAGTRSGQSDGRREAVQLRRLIAERLAEISVLGDAVFAASGEHTTFRNEFAQMRSAVAYHQASWPIVGIEPMNPHYQDSVKAVREANRKFIQWVRWAVQG